MEIRNRLKKENFSIYFHNGVEIEFDNETLLGQLFGPEIINEQGVAQVDVFLPSAALVTIKSERNFEILVWIFRQPFCVFLILFQIRPKQRKCQELNKAHIDDPAYLLAS